MYLINRKYYRELADYGYLNYPDEFRKHVHEGLHRINKKTGEFKAYQDKYVATEIKFMGNVTKTMGYSLVEIDTPPDLPVEWWRKEKSE